MVAMEMSLHNDKYRLITSFKTPRILVLLEEHVHNLYRIRQF